MINPFTLIWETVSTVIYYLLIIGLPLAAAIAFLWLISYWYNSKNIKDDIKEEHLKMVHVAKSHKDKSLKELLLVPVPNQKMNDEGIDKYTERVSNSRALLPLGKIVGHQEIDCLGLNVKDAVKAKVLTEQQAIAAEQQIDSLKKMGLSTLHHFVYTSKGGGWLGGVSSEHSLIAFDDQILNLQSSDGRVLIKGVGVRKIGEYEVLQGYPERTSVILAHIAISSSMETVLSLIGQTRAIVGKAIDLDSQHYKQIQILGAQKQAEEVGKV